nr:pentatricopeptide repeat-containing protein At1g26900, mitochondrial [Quercus suber]
MASLFKLTYLRQTLNIWSKLANPKQHYSISSQDQKLLYLLNSCKQTSETSQVHGFMVKTGLDHVPFTLSKLLDTSTQDMEYAASIFKYVQDPNLFMFNTMLRGYSISDDPVQAFGVFNHLRGQSIGLDEFCFPSILKACARVLGIVSGQGIHGLVLRSGHGLFIRVKNTLLHLYCVCGRIGDARKLFDEFPQRNDLVSWNSLMVGYVQVSQPIMVLDLYWKMCRSGLRASITTVLSVLSATGDCGNLLGAKSLHGHCIKVGFCSYLNVVTAMIDMYAKAGNVELGRRVFDEVAEKDVVLWNCLIDKYARNGMVENAVALLRQMKLQQVKPNSSTLAGLLSVCAASGAINVGRCINDYVEEEKMVLDMVLGTALVDMYAKCGFLEKAIEIFDRMVSKDVKSWTAMISGYGAHGQARNAIMLFYRMEEEGFRPNEITFLAVLSACSHGGLVSEGMRCFERMVCEYGLSPKVEHYGCLIDLLGRAGLLEEAHKLIQSLPIKGDATAWRSLLAACRVYGNVELGECVKRVLVKIFDEHPTDSILLSSTYAIAGRLPEERRMQEMKEDSIMKEVKCHSVGTEKEKLIKEAGCSIIEMDSQ